MQKIQLHFHKKMEYSFDTASEINHNHQIEIVLEILNKMELIEQLEIPSRIPKFELQKLQMIYIAASELSIYHVQVQVQIQIEIEKLQLRTSKDR